MFAGVVSKMFGECARKISGMPITEVGGNVLDSFAALQLPTRAAHPFCVHPFTWALAHDFLKVTLQAGR